MSGKMESMEFELWPHGKAPYAVESDTVNRERFLDADDGIKRLTDVSVPTLTFYPASGGGPHPAVLVCPGGAYSILAWNHEGTDVAGWLNSNGISVFLLKYRCPDRREAAKADAVRALRLIRAGAEGFAIDPGKIGILGFSAGAHLSASVCNIGDGEVYEHVDLADTVDAQPNFAFIIYPAYISREGWKIDPELVVAKRTPPTFIVQAQDDREYVDSSVAYWIALRDAGVPTEMHLYSRGGHGFGFLRNGMPSDAWPMLAMKWFERDVMRSSAW